MKRWHWFAIGVVGTTALLVLGYLAHRYGTRYCLALKAGNLAKEAKDKVAPIDCIEFWLNRYQGLLAGALAAGVALIVARPVFRQLREMNRQSAVAIRGVEEGYARELEAESVRLATFRDVHSRLKSVVDGFDEAMAEAERFAPDYSNNFAGQLRDYGAYLREISSMFARYPDGSPTSIARKEFLRAANTYRSTCERVLTGFRNGTFGPDVDMGEEVLTPDQTMAARDAADKTSTRALKNHGILIGKLRSETRTQWARVRHLQKMARGEI